METDACEPAAGDSSAQVEVSVKRDTRGTEYNQFLVRAIEDAGCCMRSDARHMDVLHVHTKQIACATRPPALGA